MCPSLHRPVTLEGGDSCSDEEEVSRFKELYPTTAELDEEHIFKKPRAKVSY